MAQVVDAAEEFGAMINQWGWGNQGKLHAGDGTEAVSGKMGSIGKRQKGISGGDDWHIHKRVKRQNWWKQRPPIAEW